MPTAPLVAPLVPPTLPTAAPLAPPASPVPGWPTTALTLPGGTLLPRPPTVLGTTAPAYLPVPPAAPGGIPGPAIIYSPPTTRWGSPALVGVIRDEFEREAARPPDWARRARTLLLGLALLPALTLACGSSLLGVALLTGGACVLPLTMWLLGFMTTRRRAGPPPRAFIYTLDTGQGPYAVEMYGPIRGAHLRQGQKVAFWGRPNTATGSLLAPRAHVFEDQGRPADMWVEGWTPTAWTSVGVLLGLLVIVYAVLFWSLLGPH